VSAPLEARRLAVAEALRAVALEARVQTMGARLADLRARLERVETTLLEAAFERPAAVTEPAAEDERVVVPKLALDEGRMSSTAARALFGD